MARLDRLTTLLKNVHLRVNASTEADANLVVRKCMTTGQITLLQNPHGPIAPDLKAKLLVALHVDLGKPGSPLRRALPDTTRIQVEEGDDIDALAALLAIEQAAQRCGRSIVLGRLGEVLMIRVLRHQIEKGDTPTGLLAGLAHERLSPAIVAMHENPGRRWNIADLAEVAGLSESHFKEVFARIMGETPGAYLRHWRMTLARVDIEAGTRIDQVARRYGYGAPDAFSRAFAKEFGARPKKFSRSA